MADTKNNADWFKAQLQNSLDVFVWAVAQIPQERINVEPTAEAWSVQQHIHHLYSYEKLILPFKRQWLPNADPTSQEDIAIVRHMWSEQERHWYKKDAAHWLTEFQTLRKETIQMLKKFDESAWDTEKETTFWGVKSLFWLYSKTLQHTLEHTDAVLKISLFWDGAIHE
jgi:hypothetical protein